MNTSVCFVVGSNENTHCGVKDYAVRLADALHQIGFDTEVLAPSNWGLRSFQDFRTTLRHHDWDIVHLQYPSIGNRRSFGPHLLGRMRVARKTLVTLHEYSQLPVLQRVSTHLFRWTTDSVIFTTPVEQASFGRSCASRPVIPIGSNIPVFSGEVPRTNEVLYFGQIRPNKGLEHFLAIARRSLQTSGPFTFHIAGSVPERRRDYYLALRGVASPEIRWTIDPSFEEVSELMARCHAACLPFPDGASPRRGSLLAALTNGLPAITTIGPATPDELRSVILPATGVDEFLNQLERLRLLPAEASALGKAARAYAERFSWTNIAREHERIYTQILGNSPESERPIPAVA